MDQVAKIGDAVFVRLSHVAGRRPYYTLVDCDDFDRIIRSFWCLNNGYAVATSLKALAKHHKALHAYVIRSKPGEMVDHINGDRLDNRRQNLRIVSHAENAQNSRRPNIPGKSSRFKGVCWDRKAGIWLATITANGVTSHLGKFDAEHDAARIYDRAALKLHGEHARTNEMMRLFDMPDPFVQDCSWGPRGDIQAEYVDCPFNIKFKGRPERRSHLEKKRDYMLRYQYGL